MLLGFHCSRKQAFLLPSIPEPTNLYVKAGDMGKSAILFYAKVGHQFKDGAGPGVDVMITIFCDFP
jgi:hypothetical protein